MNDSNYSREVQNFNTSLSTSAPDHGDQYFVDHRISPAVYDNFSRRGGSQPVDVNPEEFLASQTTSLLTDEDPVEGWGVGDDLELKAAGETVVIPQRASDNFSGGPLEMATPSNSLQPTAPVEEYSQDHAMWAEVDAFLHKLSNPRSDANSNEQILETNAELTLPTNVANPLPNSQGRDNFTDSTGEPATATFLANDRPPPPFSYSSVGQVNAASSWTGGPAATTGFFAAPPNYGLLPYYPQLMGQAVVASHTPIYLDQLILIDGATAPIAYFPMAGCHQGMYRQQPFPAPATVSRHSGAQMGDGYSPYNSMAQATVAPIIQPYAGASMHVYGADPPLTQAPIAGSFAIEPRNLPASTSAQAVRRDPYELSSATEISGEPNRYDCQSGDWTSSPAVVASDAPVHSDQFATMHGATAPVPHFRMAQGMYRQQPFVAPATVSHDSNAQMGGGYSPYNPVAQATVAPIIQPYAGASMPVYGANPLLTQAAFPVETRNSHATASAQGARRGPYELLLATEISGEPKLYHCQWEGCSARAMTYTNVLEHFRAHGERIEGTNRIKECKWAGCKAKAGAFPMTCDGFRRHVKETQSHATIGGLTKVKCGKCGKKEARRSNHRWFCPRKSNEPEGNGKKRQDSRSPENPPYEVVFLSQD